MHAHMEAEHKVYQEFDIILAVRFLDSEEKDEIIEKIRKIVFEPENEIIENVSTTILEHDDEIVKNIRLFETKPCLKLFDCSKCGKLMKEAKKKMAF